ncbi:MAG: glycosyltransferase [Chitinophagaceae bacterium]|nr:glycosyltransferase [Chitinophagaceae bacterium]
MANVVANFEATKASSISFLCAAMMSLFYIFSVCILIQTSFAIWMLWLSGSSKSSTPAAAPQNEAMSIVICARNEASNLAQNLPLILAQQHTHYEEIVVNDASDDDSDTILQALATQHSNLRIVTIAPSDERNLPGKKHALSKGIAAAQYDNLLLCDADCSPASEQWASIMSNALHHKKQIVAGYGAYLPAPGWLNKFIRWETLHSYLQYSTYAQSGIPYMAVGRNLAVKKELLVEAQAQPLWASMPSGDDDLLIRLMGNKHNVAIIADTEAATNSVAKNNLNEWLAQKQRHLSTGKLYRKHIQILLGVYALSHGLTWLLWLVLWLAGYGYLVSSLMILRCMLTWSLWGITAHNLKESSLIIWLPLCDIGWAIYNLILSPYIFFKTKTTWK